MSAEELNSIYNAHWGHLFSVCLLQTLSLRSSHRDTEERIQAADEEFKLLTKYAEQERSALR